MQVGAFAGTRASSHLPTLPHLTHQHQTLTHNLESIHPWACNERRKAPSALVSSSACMLVPHEGTISRCHAECILHTLVL